MARGETHGRSDDLLVGVPAVQSDGFGFQMTLPTTHGRTDGVFTVVLPSVPGGAIPDDDVLVAFEHGDVRPHPIRDYALTLSLELGPTLAIEEYWL
jgi:hypothetical protein